MSRLQDLLFGARLSLSSGRRSLVRLTLTAVGIGLGVAVLLLAASVPTMLDRYQARTDARSFDTYAAGDTGVDHPAGPATLIADDYTEYRGAGVHGQFMQGDGPGAPVPPGVDRLPAPGEVFVSPALAELLASPDGALLAPRIPGRTVGVIAPAGLEGPGALSFIAGADLTSNVRAKAGYVQQAYSFGVQNPRDPLPPILYLLLVVGVVVLLLPVLVFVATAARMGGDARDKRLAALRLVGAGSAQVRRIAAGEALAGALLGLVVGGLLFLAGRQAVPHFQVAGSSFFAADVAPAAWLAVLVVLAVPASAVAVAQFALRSTAIEPLGVVRSSTPTRRRLWWRVVPVALGVALLLGATARSETSVAAGSVLLLFGVPLLLPWATERLVGALGRRGAGNVSWQLAVGRLRLDTGTPARVVGGVGVVLAGAVALQTVLAAAAAGVAPSSPADQRAVGAPVTVQVDGSVDPAAVSKRLAAVPDTRVEFTRAGVALPPEGNYQISYAVADCAAVMAGLAVRSCTDGQVFFTGDEYGNGYRAPAVGERVTFAGPGGGTAVWTPSVAAVQAQPLTDDWYTGLVVITPKALGATKPAYEFRSWYVSLGAGATSDTVERIRNAAAPWTWLARVDSYSLSDRFVTTDQKTYQALRATLLAGAMITLGLAGASLLVLALEQITERRRQLAMLAASGVPRTVLARSVLWQNAVPMALATPVALVSGVVLALLLLHTVDTPAAYDWAGIATLSGAAAGLVLVATALTLPSLRRATRPLELRAE